MKCTSYLPKDGAHVPCDGELRRLGDLGMCPVCNAAGYFYAPTDAPEPFFSVTLDIMHRSLILATFDNADAIEQLRADLTG